MYFKKDKCNKKKGFTLIELIIVIAIIVVLAIVTMPKLKSIVNKANGAGVTVDFNSTFKNNVKGRVIVNHALPTEAQLATDLSQFACVSSVGVDGKPFTADDTAGTLTFATGTNSMDLFADGSLYDLTNTKVAYLGGEGGKKYAVVKEDSGNSITFIAGHLIDKLAIKMTLAGNDIASNTGLANGLLVTIPIIVYNPESDFVFDGVDTITGITVAGQAKPIINVPPTLGGKVVKVIGTYVFWDCQAVTKITMPSGVTTIKDGAFQNCGNVVEIVLPNSVIIIEGHAFTDCVSLKTVQLPNNITKIDWMAFYNCTALESLVIPSSVTYIENGAFDSCWALTSITIPSSVTVIGEYAFDGCNAIVVKTPLGSYARTCGYFPAGTTFIQ